MKQRKKNERPPSELRQDPVSGDWVLLAPLRARRGGFVFKGRVPDKLPKSKCPFDNLKKSGNAPPVLVYQKESGKDWFLQIIPNKYPAVTPDHGGFVYKKGLYRAIAGRGHHEIVILRDHDRQLAEYGVGEIKKLLTAYLERYRILAQNQAVEYISIFHNHGREAGSTVPHPHSQILALPVVPPDVSHSLGGSRRYFHERGKCIHCQMISQELKEKKRVVYENAEMAVFAPFASHSDFELRIFPKKHQAYFDKMENGELKFLAAAFKDVFSKLFKKLKDPAFNFFIHTAPVSKTLDYGHYHWHVEILPRLNLFGGFELGTGIDIVSVPPETAAKFLKK